mmetsp:Transcript_2024/g.3185  ORF Transcript_2024/g.3185 Transcript_2024/m.3185 type:complete len:99 (+) Transcript_2024:469-765(+)
MSPQHNIIDTSPNEKREPSSQQMYIYISTSLIVSAISSFLPLSNFLSSHLHGVSQQINSTQHGRASLDAESDLFSGGHPSCRATEKFRCYYILGGVTA